VTRRMGTEAGIAVQWVADAKDTPETISGWYSRATINCTPFIFTEWRFRSPWVDDQFGEDVRRVRGWLTDNPCPRRFDRSSPGRNAQFLCGDDCGGECQSAHGTARDYRVAQQVR
jgi:hypothetical protein